MSDVVAAPPGPSPAPDASGAPPPVPLLSLLSGLAAVLLVVAVVGVTVAGGLARYGTEQIAGPVTTLPRGSAGPATAAGGLPTRPADDPLLTPAAVRADFAGAGSALTPLATIGAWEPVAGTWAQVGGAAALRRAGGDRSLLLVDAARSPRIVQVTLATVETNAGLVAGYQDPAHYLVLVAVPAQQALWLAAVDGDPSRPSLLAVVPDAPLRSGVVIGLRIAAEQVTVVVNGQVARTIGYEVAGPRFGLTSGGAGSPATARFDDVAVLAG